jgi:hypothetical protein
LTGHKTQ